MFTTWHDTWKLVALFWERVAVWLAGRVQEDSTALKFNGTAVQALCFFETSGMNYPATQRIRSVTTPDCVLAYGKVTYRDWSTIQAQWLLHVSRGCMLGNAKFFCFVWISEQPPIISLYNINWLLFISEMLCVYCAVRTGCLSISHVSLGL